MPDKVADHGESGDNEPDVKPEVNEPAVVEPDITESQVVATSPRHTRIIGLDGMRGIGAFAVVFGHIAENYAPTVNKQYMIGMLGVALLIFFCLSGFLLFLPYVRRLTADPNRLKMPSTSQYGLHRLLRVFPGYLVIFLIVNFVFRIAYIDNPATHPKGQALGTGMITDPGQLLANLTLTQTYFPAYIQTGLNPSWSLTTEILFYASLPFLGMLLFRLRGRWKGHPLVLACLAPAILLVIGVVCRLFAPMVADHFGIHQIEMQNWGPNWVAVFLRSYPANADIFAFGMLAAVLFVALEQEVVREAIARRVRMLCTVGLLLSAVVSLYLAADQSYFATMAIGALSGLLILSVVVPLARGQETALTKWLDSKPFFFIGTISLSIYLWHYPVLLLLGRYNLQGSDTWPGLLRSTLIVGAVTILFSTLTYYLVERPALNSAKYFRRK
ncbi:MAG: acyltransferase [Mycobacterium sp.]|nr:acyltransferase [Mycobacterium sp.]